MQVREASLLPRSQAESPYGPVKNSIPNTWLESGLGQLSRIEGNPETKLNYAENSGEQTVAVTTKIAFKPFLTVPFPGSVPGLNAPVTFTYSAARQMENSDNVTR